MDRKPLSPRELSILRAAAEGISSKDTARRMGISPATVRTHKEKALAKLGAHSVVHAVAIATREGLIR